jgi:hypothetical protein
MMAGVRPSKYLTSNIETGCACTIDERISNGKYLSFRLFGSLRIRVNHVRGKNAALSGIFFDDAGKEPPLEFEKAFGVIIQLFFSMPGIVKSIFQIR